MYPNQRYYRRDSTLFNIDVHQGREIFHTFPVLRSFSVMDKVCIYSTIGFGCKHNDPFSDCFIFLLTVKTSAIVCLCVWST